MKRKGKGGKRCRDGARVAGRADAGSRARKLLDSWIVDTWEHGDSEETLAALVELSFAEAMARSQGPHDPDTLHTWRVMQGIGDGMADWPLRQDW